MGLYSEAMPSTVGASRRTLRRSLLPVGIITCLLVLIVSVAGVAGALDELPPAPLPEIAEDELHEGQPWNVTVDGAALSTELEPAQLLEDGYWLAVVAEVEVTADTSRSDVTDVLYVTEVDGLAREHAESSQYPDAVFADDVRLVRDGSRAELLHPGMTERLVFLWELARDTPAPTTVEVVITGKTLRRDSLSGELEWLDGAATAGLTVTVLDWRDE